MIAAGRIAGERVTSSGSRPESAVTTIDSRVLASPEGRACSPVRARTAGRQCQHRDQPDACPGREPSTSPRDHHAGRSLALRISSTMRSMIVVIPKSFGREDRRDAGGLHLAGVGVGDDAADDQRHVADAGLRHGLLHVRHELHVRAREDRQADAVDVLGHRRGDDLGRRQADALVDDLEAGVARAYGDLLGAVGVPVETGLADEQPQPAAELVAGAAATFSRTAVSSAPASATPTTPLTPVGARYSPKTSRSAPAHSPDGRTGARTAARVASIRLSSVLASARSRSSASSTAAWSRCARHSTTSAIALASASGIGRHDRRRRGRRSAARARSR